MVEQPISIIIPAFNQVEYCAQCVQSILADTTSIPYRLILVDNGSTDGVGEFFDIIAESVPTATVIHAGTNRGFAGGVNLGLAQATGHVVLLNSDTLCPEGWLSRLETALLQSDDIGIIGPVSNCVSGSQQVDTPELNSMDAINRFAQDRANQHTGRLRPVARLVGFCWIMRESVWRSVGTFDEGYGIGNFEDDDYCVRTIRAGYRLCVAEDAFVFHYGSRTFMAMGITDDKWRNLIQENQQRFTAKWTFQPQERLDEAQASLWLNKQARAAAEQGNLKDAMHLLRQAIEQFPTLDTNYNDLGVLLWQLGHPEKALEQFQRALRLNPDSAEARENIRIATESSTA